MSRGGMARWVVTVRLFHLLLPVGFDLHFLTDSTLIPIKASAAQSSL